MSLRAHLYLFVAFGGLLTSCGSGGGGRPDGGQGQAGWHAETGGESGHPGAGTSGGAGSGAGAGGGAGSSAGGSGGAGGNAGSASGGAGGSAGSTAGSGGAGGNAGTGGSHTGGAGGHPTGGSAGAQGGAAGAAGAGTGGGAGHPSVDAGSTIPDGAVTDGPPLAKCTNQALGAVDFDGDGIPDCVLTTQGATSGSFAGYFNLVFHKGLGDGTFSGVGVTTSNALPPNFNPISTADLDGDGIRDLTEEGIMGPLTYFVYLRGQSDGLFAQSFSQTPTALGDAAGFGAFEGDFNDDGHSDLFLASWTYPAPNAGHGIDLVVLSGLGGVTFPNRPTASLGVAVTSSGVAVGARGSAKAVAVGDLNNDHNLDGVVIVTDMNLTGPSNTRVLVALGDGKGHFTSPAEVAGTDGVTSVTLADVNTDGNPDLQVYINSATTPATFYGDGAGHFSTTPP
jgi:hypothetical protein